MSSFHQGQTFTLTTDDNQTLTYTIAKVCADGRLLVRSSLLEMAYFISPGAFEDFLRVIGWQAPTKYHVWLVNFGWYMQNEYDTLNQAVEAARHTCFDSRIDLDQMVCATYSYFGGLRYTEEYKRWCEDQERALAQVAGETV